MLVFRASGRVVSVRPGRLRGQRIVDVVLDGVNVSFDAVEGLVDFTEGEVVTLSLTTAIPEDLDDYDFCGHGYLVVPEDEAGKTIFSVWGILFVFSKPLGLRDNTKYYICIRKHRG